MILNPLDGHYDLRCKFPPLGRIAKIFGPASWLNFRVIHGRICRPKKMVNSPCQIWLFSWANHSVSFYGELVRYGKPTMGCVDPTISSALRASHWDVILYCFAHSRCWAPSSPGRKVLRSTHIEEALQVLPCFTTKRSWMNIFELYKRNISL